MEFETKTELIDVVISPWELWVLAKPFTPGWVFGIENPTDGLSAEEISEKEKMATEALTEVGVISFDGGQLNMDEILAAMVYSLIHPSDILVVNNETLNSQKFYYFLPDWQLEMVEKKGKYHLRLFRYSVDLFGHIVSLEGVYSVEKGQAFEFSLPARSLEMATFLYESGKEKQAFAIFDDAKGTLPPKKDFLKGFSQPDQHFIFDMIYNKNADQGMRTQKYELVLIGDNLYWFFHDMPKDQETLVVRIKSISLPLAEKYFAMMLPA